MPKKTQRNWSHRLVGRRRERLVLSASLGLCAALLLAGSCERKVAGPKNDPAKTQVMGAKRPTLAGAMGAPRPTASPGTSGNALALPNASGIKALTFEEVPKLQRLSVPLDKVVAHARQHCKTLWYGLYMRNRKLGFGTMGCAIEKRGGQEVYVEKARLVAEINSFGRTERMSLTGKAVFALTGRGELLHSKESQATSQEHTTVTIDRKPDGWHVVRTYRGASTRKPPEKKTLPEIKTDLTNSERAYVTALALGQLKPGMRYRFYDFDDEDLKDRDVGLQVLASTDRQLRGVTVRIHRVEVLALKEKMRSTGTHDSIGDLLEGTMMGVMRIKREEKATAKRMDSAAVDFGLGLVIRASMKVPDPARVKKMKVRLTGYLPESVGKNARHTLVKQANRDFELTVVRESLAGLAPLTLPVSDPKLAEHLKATHKIEAAHPVIKAMARRASGGAKTAQEAARKINAFVFKYLRKSLSTNLDSALAIAKARAGDCTEHARLMVALCRAVGLPAREVGGVTWAPDLRGFGYHAWVEVWLGKWIAVDPSWNEFPANATHIWMGGPHDARWMGTLGGLKAKILSVETAK